MAKTSVQKQKNAQKDLTQIMLDNLVNVDSNQFYLLYRQLKLLGTENIRQRHLSFSRCTKLILVRKQTIVRQLFEVKTKSGSDPDILQWRYTTQNKKVKCLAYFL